MKIKITKAALKAVLDKCAATVPLRATMSILSTALFEASGDTLSVTTTNMEQRVTAKTECEVLEGGSVCIRHRGILDWVDSVSGDIVISVNEKNVVSTKCGRADGKIAGLPASEFVAKGESGKPSQAFSDENGVIATLINKVKNAVCLDETRPVICGVHFGEKGGLLKLEAADGRRAHIVETPIEIAVDAIIPTAAIPVIASMFAEVPCEYRIFENRIEISSTASDFTSKIIEGSFPSIDRIIPEKTDSGITLPVDQFTGAMREVKSALDKDFRLRIKSTKKSVTISTENGEDTNASEMECKQKTEIKFALNYNFMKDALSAIDGDIFKIEMSETAPLGAAVIREDNLTIVIMPLRETV